MHLSKQFRSSLFSTFGGSSKQPWLYGVVRDSIPIVMIPRLPEVKVSTPRGCTDSFHCCTPSFFKLSMWITSPSPHMGIWRHEVETSIGDKMMPHGLPARLGSQKVTRDFSRRQMKAIITWKLVEMAAQYRSLPNSKSQFRKSPLSTSLRTTAPPVVVQYIDKNPG